MAKGEDKTIKAEVPTSDEPKLSGVIAQYIGAVMEDPKAMKALEDQVRLWLDEQTDKTPESKTLVLQQLVRGRQVMESIHSLVFQGYQVY